MAIDHLNNFNIELSDIWNYEKILFEEELKYKKNEKSNIQNQQHFLEVYRNSIDICINYGKSYLTKEKSIAAYVRFQEIYKAKKSFKERINIGWFDFKHALYYLPQSILIPKEDEAFHYFFALKLDQYDEDVFLLDEFLSYQLLTNFDDDLEEITGFLQNLLIQHQFLGDRVYEKTNKFIQEIKQALKQNKDQYTKKSSSKNKKLSYRSFTLIGTKNNPDFFLKNNQAFHNVFDLLREKKYIHNDTSYTQFKSLFSNECSTTNNRIHWIANAVDLKAFISILCDHGKIVKPNSGIWVLTSQYFIDKNKQDFDPRNLGNSVPSEDTKRSFRKIVAQFP